RRCSARRPSSSAPSAVKNSQRPLSRAICRATTAPPPAGSDRTGSPCTISPAPGTCGTSANSTHSTCPTTAHLMRGSSPTAATAPSHKSGTRAVPTMMEVVAERIPPFERFYLEHRDEVLGYLRRLLAGRAEDAWQETFLRALRAYGSLQHGRHLRAWVFTIATNVALDELRADSRDGHPEPHEPAVELRRDAFREIEHLTDQLPPT